MMGTTPPLSLHHLTLLDAGHEELIDIAAQHRVDHVCLFVNVPQDMASMFKIVSTPAAARQLRERLDGVGVSVWNLEAFHIDPAIDPETFRPALEIGAILGGRGTTAINVDPDPASAADRLASFAAIAADYGLTVGLEWIRPSATRTLTEAIDLVQASGAANVKLTVDPLHLMRNGGAPADLRRLSPDIIGYTQICDGPATMPEEDQWLEMIEGRMVPGEGAFPLVDYLSSLPHIPVLAMEVPQRALHAIVAPADRAARVIAATRALLSVDAKR